MRKVFTIFAIATLAACGGGVSNNPTVDTTSSTVTQDTNYYKELNKQRLKEIADSTTAATSGGSSAEAPKDAPADAIK